MNAMRILIFALTAITIAALAGCVSDDVQMPYEKVDLPQASITNTQLARDYMNQGRLDVAFQKVKRAISENDDNAQAHALLGMIYAKRDNAAEGEKEMRRAVEIAPDDASIQNLFGAFLCDHGKPDEGIAHFSKAAQNLQFATPEQALTNAGICAMNSNQLDKAGQFLNKAVDVAPNYPDALLATGDLAYRLRQYQRALAFLERYESRAAASPKWLLLMVKTERQLGDFDSSRNYEAQLVHDFPTSAEAMQLRQKPNS